MTEHISQAIGSTELPLPELTGSLQTVMNGLEYERGYHADNENVLCDLRATMGHGSWLVIAEDDRFRKSLARQLSEAFGVELLLFAVSATESEESGRKFDCRVFRVRPNQVKEVDPPRVDVPQETDQKLEDDSMKLLESLLATETSGSPMTTVETRNYTRPPASDDPRLNHLVDAIEDAKTWTVEEQDDGRLAIEIEAMEGGRQISFVNADQLDAIRELLDKN